jgi:hypothetical protein
MRNTSKAKEDGDGVEEVKWQLILQNATFDREHTLILKLPSGSRLTKNPVFPAFIFRQGQKCPHLPLSQKCK